MTAGTDAQSAQRSTEDQASAWVLAALLLLATVLRLVPTWFQPTLDHPDEIFQTMEQAHRLVYGSGLVPWEFRLGARSWLLPGVIAALMQLAQFLGDGPGYYLPVVYLAFAFLGAVPVVCCFLWSRRFFGLTGAIIGGAVVAVAPDLVYFGARTLSEVVASHVLVAALYVLAPGYLVTCRRRLIAGGALLSLSFILRFHLGPAIALAVLWVACVAPRLRLPMIAAGVLAMVAIDAVFDMLTLGAPLAAIWRNFLYNIGYGVSSNFGESRHLLYVVFEYAIWQDKLFMLGLLALIGAWRLPLLAAVAITIVVVHSAIPHKEYRFIFPAVELIAVLAGTGLAQCTTSIATWMERSIGPAARWRFWIAGLAITCWCLIAFDVWSSPFFNFYRSRSSGNLLAASFVARLPNVCGIGLYNDRTWGPSGGYTYLHRALPLYWFETEADLAANFGYDTLIYTKPLASDLGFERLACFGKVCVARRHRRCVPTPMARLPLPEPLDGVVADP